MNANLLMSIPEEELMSLPFFKNRGVYFLDRAFVDDETGRRELAFSNAIKKYHEGPAINSFTSVVERDSQTKEEAMFTVFQWLTTNVGSSVLDEALKATGRKIVNID